MAHRYDTRLQRWVDDAGGGHAAVAERQRRAERTAILVSAGVLLVFSLGFGLWQAEPGTDGGPVEETDPGRTPTPEFSTGPEQPGWPAYTEPPTPSDIPDWMETYGQGVTPGGYERIEDEAGWSVAIPVGWGRTAREGENDATVVNYESPEDHRRLQVFWVEDNSPYESVTLADEELRETASEYRRISLKSLPGGAAVLEYTYEKRESGSSRHAVDHRFRASDGEYYAIAGSGPAGGSRQEAEMVQVAVSSFCPEAAECEKG